MKNQIGPKRVRCESPEAETLCARSHAPGQRFDQVFGFRGVEKRVKTMTFIDFCSKFPIRPIRRGARRARAGRPWIAAKKTFGALFGAVLAGWSVNLSGLPPGPMYNISKSS